MSIHDLLLLDTVPLEEPTPVADVVAEVVLVPSVVDAVEAVAALAPAPPLAQKPLYHDCRSWRSVSMVH